MKTTMLMVVKTIKAIHKPGYLIHEWLVRTEGSETAATVICALSGLIGVTCVFASMWPMKSFLYFLGALILSGLLTGLCMGVSSFIVAAVMWSLTLLFTPPAYIYRACTNYIIGCGRKNKGNSMGRGPKPEIGLRYFIEKEKNISSYSAKWISAK